MVWDFTCRDTLAPINLVHLMQEGGKTANEAETSKLSKYNHMTTTFTVIPIGTETLGPWGKTGLKFVKDIGQRIQDLTGDKRSTSYLFQSISIAIQRGNAASFKGTIPDIESLDELFYLV